VIGLLDHAIILYSSFIGALMVIVAYILKDWLSCESSCYSWSFGATLEVLWTVLPVLFLFCITVHGLGVLYAMDATRSSCSSWVNVVGHQWYWEYGTEGGMYDSRMVMSKNLEEGMVRLSMVDGVLFLPAEVVTGLCMTSADVLHSWSVPALGVKLDCVPGRSSLCSVLPRSVGVVGGYCAELCGVGHAFMPILVCCYSSLL
jgi:heme/copper-type cytochrome/quinol oxidase subunit 2